MNSYRAKDVLIAAQAAFSFASSNPEYIRQKADNFLYRCGAILEKGPDQPLAANTVKLVVTAMLDIETEKIFYRTLKNL